MASYKLILDRMVGSHHLHKNVAIVGAGNLETDNAIVQPMSTALQSRLAHLELEIDPQEWIDWANKNGVDHRITSFINFKPGLLFTFKPDHTDKTYGCPRTWKFANGVMQDNPLDSKLAVPLLSGILSEGLAREFIQYSRIYESLPTIQQIMDRPQDLKVPDEPSVLYAITGSIAHNTSKENIDKLMVFIRRLPMEFQVVCLRDMKSRHGSVSGFPAVAKWVTENASELF